MNKENRRAVIFDLDGTLLDTLLDLTNAANHVREMCGLPALAPDTVRKYLGNGTGELLYLSLREKVNKDELGPYIKEYMEYYKAHISIETGPYDGVKELLKRLKDKGIKISVVSNKPDVAVSALCRVYFGDMVDFTVGDRPDMKRKPDAAPVKLAIESLGCDKAVYVGDSEVDVLTAKNAELPCISVTWGFRDRDELERCGADIFVSNMTELENMIYKLLGMEGVYASE